MKVPHVYNAASTSAGWTNWINGALLFSTNVNTVEFPAASTSKPRLGGSSSGHFHGSIAELLIFDRALTPAERGAVTTNYFRQRFNLW